MKLRLLVVDDSEPHLDAVRARLSAEGYDVAVAVDSLTAIRQIGSCDLVLVDFHMPCLDGAQLLAMLRPLVPPGSPIFFYLYTADPEVALSFKNYGFDGAFTHRSLDDLVAQLRSVERLLLMRRFMARKPTQS